MQKLCINIVCIQNSLTTMVIFGKSRSECVFLSAVQNKHTILLVIFAHV
jgi:hypothetical protein